jgi:hypothetical protein
MAVCFPERSVNKLLFAGDFCWLHERNNNKTRGYKQRRKLNGKFIFLTQLLSIIKTLLTENRMMATQYIVEDFS